MVAILLACGSAAAELPALPELPPPPRVTRTTAIGNNIALHLNLWYELFKGKGCILAEQDPARKIQGVGNLIAQHKERAEQAALVDYFNHHIVPHGQAWLAGVPGFGTYSELMDRRLAALAWYDANQPKGPVDTAEQAKAYVAAYQAYRAKVAEDHKFVTALNAASACHNQGSPPDGSPGAIPQINGFSIWKHESTPEAVERRLAPSRNKLVPQRIAGEEDALRVLEEARTSKLDSLFAYGKVLKNAYGAHAQLEGAKPDAERMTWFAVLYTGERGATMTAAPRRVTELQADMGALIVKLIQVIKPSTGVGGVPAATAKKVLTGKHILAARATSPTRTADKLTTDEKALTSTTVQV